MEDIIKALKNSDREATAAPYWLILDPSQNMRCNIDEMAGGITGPFFSRKDAEDILILRKHHYSKKARVYCLSGHNSWKYKSFCEQVIGR